MSLEGSLETATNGAGDAVMFMFTVTNSGDEQVNLQFSDACKAEFVVTEDGQEVWRFTEGRMFAQMLSTETLAPGEQVTYEAEWMNPDPGGYVAVAELRAQETTCEGRTDFAVQ